MDLQTSMQLAFGGMAAQGNRLKVIAENLANADSTPTTPGGDPYRRKVISFRSVLDRSLGATAVRRGRSRAPTAISSAATTPETPSPMPTAM